MQIFMRKFYLLLFFLAAICTFSERVSATSVRTDNTLSAAASSCTATGTVCLIVPVDVNQGAAAFTVSTNASANTIQFEATGDGGGTWVALNATPSNSTTAATSTTSTGTWQANVAGYTHVRVRMSTLVSGTNLVSITQSTASARSGGGGAGAVSSVFTRTGAVVATSGDYTCAQVTNCANNGVPFGPGAGSVNAMTVTTTGPATNAAGTIVEVNLPNLANTTTATLAVNGLTALPIVKGPNQAALIAADYNTTTVAYFSSDGTNWQLLNPLNSLLTAYTSVGSGTVGAPAYNFSSCTNCGLYYNGSNQVDIAAGGAAMVVFTPINGLNGLATNVVQFSTANSDVVLYRAGLGNPQWGNNSATPQAFIFNLAPSSRAATDTNVAGANFTEQPGNGTGNATPSLGIWQAPALGGTTGTGAETQTIRMAYNDTKALTTGSPTTVLSIPLASLAMAEGVLTFGIEATDGTSQCTLSGDVSYTAENSAGVFVTNTSVLGTAGNACTATKTLTATWALTSANPALLQVTPTLVGITATRFSIIYEVHHFGQTQPTL